MQPIGLQPGGIDCARRACYLVITPLSQVRSVSLDSWTPEMAAALLQLGSRAAASHLLALALNPTLTLAPALTQTRTLTLTLTPTLIR